MGFNSLPKQSKVESAEEKPKNNFVELYKYYGRRSENASTENGRKAGESYDSVLFSTHFELETLYRESMGLPIYEVVDEQKLNTFINSIPVESLDRIIDSLTDFCLGVSKRMRRNGEIEDAESMLSSIRAYAELQSKL